MNPTYQQGSTLTNSSLRIISYSAKESSAEPLEYIQQDNIPSTVRNLLIGLCTQDSGLPQTLSQMHCYYQKQPWEKKISKLFFAGTVKWTFFFFFFRQQHTMTVCFCDSVLWTGCSSETKRCLPEAERVSDPPPLQARTRYGCSSASVLQGPSWHRQASWLQWNCCQQKVSLSSGENI